MSVFTALAAISTYSYKTIIKQTIPMGSSANKEKNKHYNDVRNLILDVKPAIDKRMKVVGGKYDCRDCAYIGKASILESALYDPSRMSADVAVVDRLNDWGGISSDKTGTHALVQLTVDGTDYILEPQTMTWAEKSKYPNKIIRVGGNVNPT